jgi:hypothetical protein
MVMPGEGVRGTDCPGLPVALDCNCPRRTPACRDGR